MGRFSHWSEQKQPNVPAVPEAAVLGLHRTIFFGTVLYSNRGDLIQTSNKQMQRLDPWKLLIFLSFHLIFNVRASVNRLRGSQQSPFSLFSCAKQFIVMLDVIN